MLNAPGSSTVKLTSIGHYEGDTLVIDTVGLSSKAPTDYYLTPHTDKLHVVERYHVIDGGKTLEVNITVDDPGAFNLPWTASQKYQKGAEAAFRALKGERWYESVCAESESVAASRPEDPQNGLPPSPTATRPDF